MNRKNGKLQCPFCSVIRSSILSLLMHVSLNHEEKQYQFVQEICDRKIISKNNSKRPLHKDALEVVPMANRLGVQIRYKKTNKSNYKMPREFHFRSLN